MISIIVAISKNNVIGKDNKLLWNIPEDLKHFKEITLNSKIIMGRKTFESLPGILPKRQHIILTKNKNYKVNSKEVKIVYDFKTIISDFYDSDEEVYYFDKAEYEKIMAQVYNAAYLEEINAIADNKTLFLKMELDGGGLFWKQDGTCIGNVETLTLDDSKDIKLNVDGLQQWANNYMCNVLVPSESGEITIEQINKTFNWKLFHRQGIELAVEVKKLLPKNVFLKYVTPFEDESNLIPKEILIREDRWYIRNILEKLI